jgi:two-component system CheB/CheR fusion protein
MTSDDRRDPKENDRDDRPSGEEQDRVGSKGEARPEEEGRSEQEAGPEEEAGREEEGGPEEGGGREEEGRSEQDAGPEKEAGREEEDGPDEAGGRSRSLHAANKVPVVAIGSSAGGLDALKRFFSGVSSDLGVAFVVISHHEPSRGDLLPELLSKSSSMPVHSVSTEADLEADNVYVASGEALVIKDDSIGVRELDEGEIAQPERPIDMFMRSLAAQRGERAICVILSGMGSDGTLGMRAIKGDLGMAMVQDPETAQFRAMPESALATDLADYVLPPEEMGKKLEAYLEQGFVLEGHRAGAEEEAAEKDEAEGKGLDSLFAVLRERTGNDFSMYKRATVQRRVERRMNVHQIEDIEEYIELVKRDRRESTLLFKELLIGVTSFFREPRAFEELAGALAELLRNHPADRAFRAWVPGASTGEEAYSLAIVVREQMDMLGMEREVQIFASDLDEDAVEKGRQGRFPAGIAQDVGKERLKKFFRQEGDEYVIRKDLREWLVFAVHNVAIDPPFINLDVMSCRNLLIYLKNEVQKKLFPLFHYALNPGGLLFLGSSESIGRFDDYFDTVSKKAKIYKRKHRPKSQPAPNFPEMRSAHERMGKRSGGPGGRRELQGPRGIRKQADRLLLTVATPPSVLVERGGSVVYVHGRTGQYLELAPGQANLDLVDMARPGLGASLAALLRKIGPDQPETTRRNIPVETNGETTSVDVTVRYVDEPDELEGLLLVSFRESPVSDVAEAVEPGEGVEGDQSERERALRAELQSTREDLQTTIEELETSNEELKSTNEELQSTNEELQSANEELETSREETQSLNEELNTVNDELRSKVADLSAVNDDMRNLLNATPYAVIFLSRELTINRFTRSARRLFNLIESDVGRPISDIRASIDYPELEEDAHKVLDTLSPVERQIPTVERKEEADGESDGEDGSVRTWYLMRLVPYRTSEERIAGLVLVAVDITEMKRADKKEEAAKEYAESIVQTVREPLLVLDANLRIKTANKSFLHVFEIQRGDVEGASLTELGKGGWNIGELKDKLGDVLMRDEPFEGYEVWVRHAAGKRRRLLLNGRQVVREPEKSHLVLLAMEVLEETDEPGPETEE